jgi:hypothetical protein
MGVLAHSWLAQCVEEEVASIRTSKSWAHQIKKIIDYRFIDTLFATITEGIGSLQTAPFLLLFYFSATIAYLQKLCIIEPILSLLTLELSESAAQRFISQKCKAIG